VIQLPCIYNTVTWGTYALAELLTLTGTTDFSFPINPGQQRVGWADSTVDLPVAWTAMNGVRSLLSAQRRRILLQVFQVSNWYLTNRRLDLFWHLLLELPTSSEVL